MCVKKSASAAPDELVRSHMAVRGVRYYYSSRRAVTP